MVQPPAPERPITGGTATDGRLAQVLVPSFFAALPLYRQAQIFARQGVELDRSTLCDWVGRACWWLEPLWCLLRRHVMSSTRIFADDTTLPVLDPGRGRTKTGRLWGYAIDDRPWGGSPPPAVVYLYAEDRKGEHPAAHLAGFRGVLQVDGYSGFKRLLENRPPGEVRLAFCWAHCRRRFYEIHQATGSPLAEEALRRIGELYEVEAEIRGRSAEEGGATRRERGKPLVDALHGWLTAQLGRVSGKSGLAEAIRYALRHWPGLVLFLDDDRLELDTNIIEREIRPIATRRSLCPPFASVWKHWELVPRLAVTRAGFPPERGGDPLVPQVGRPDLGGRAAHDLLGREDPLADQTADGVAADAQCRGGFAQGEPLAVLHGRAVGADAVDGAQAADAPGGPGFPLAGAHPHPVQRRGDMLVAPASGHAPHHRQRLLGRAAAVLARPGFLHPQLRVLTALPVDHEHDLARGLVDVGDDVRDQGPHEPLAGAHRRAGRVPSGLQVAGEAGEVGRVRGRGRRLLPGRQAGLARRHAAERRLPAPLQLGGDEAVVGIAGRVAPLREGRLVARLPQLQPGDAAAFGPTLHQLPLRFQRRLDRHRRQGAQQLGGDRGVDASPAERQAPRQSQHLVRPVAAVDGLSRRPARVGDLQRAAAAGPGQQAGHQRPPAASRLRGAGLPVRVRRELRLVPLVRRPVDVALVVALEQLLPPLRRLAVPVALAGAAVDDRGALLAFAVDVRPRVEGVLQHGDHVAVPDRPPVEGGQPLAVGRSREVDPVRRHRQQDLARAAQLAEPGEDQADRFPHAQVGIEAQTGLAVPRVADRHADAQLAAPRLGARGVEHAGAQHPELELADAALHAQEEPVVRVAGVVDPVEVDHPRLDQPAQLEEVVPVAPVAREPGRLEAQHGPDLAGAEPRHQPLEAGPRR